MTAYPPDGVASLQARRALAGEGVQPGHAVPEWPIPPPRADVDVAVGDWGALLGAVRERLKRTATDLESTHPESQTLDAAGQAQANVLECVAALDRLRVSLFQEFARRHARNPSCPALTDHSALGQRLEAALASSAGGALLHIDFDDVMAINDTHGRWVGDAVLRIVASRLTRAVRGEDTVSRVRGDQFVLLLGEVSNGDRLSHLACKLFDAISAPMSIGVLRLTVRPSLGVVGLPFNGGSADEVLFNARSALRRAKRNHCGYVVFDPFDDA